MSTGKMVAIAAVIILLFMGIIGACLFSGGDKDPSSPAATPVTAADRLAYLEDRIADLARQMQTLQQENTNLEDQNAQLQSRITSLEYMIEQLERER